MFGRRISFRIALAFGALAIVLAVNIGLIVSARRAEAPRAEIPSPTPIGSAVPTEPESLEPPPLVAKHAAPEEPSPIAESSAEAPKVESRYRTVFDAADR